MYLTMFKKEKTFQEQLPDPDQHQYVMVMSHLSPKCHPVILLTNTKTNTDEN